MAKWTGPELRVLAASHGFSSTRKTNGIGHDRWAAAIALAESNGGDPRAHNTVPPDNSYGLMQINMIGSLGASRRKQFNLKNNEQLFDPDTNMDVAYQIYKANGYSFKPPYGWSTYPAAAALQLPKTKGPLPDITLFDKEAGERFSKDKLLETVGEGLHDAYTLKPLTDWIESTALRAAAFVGGGLLLVIALVMLLGSANTVQGAAKTAVRAVPRPKAG